MWLQCCMSAAQVESDVAHDLAWVGARTQSRVFEKAQMLQLGMRIDGPPVRLQSVRLAAVKRSQHRKSIMSVMQCKMCTPPTVRSHLSNETHQIVIQKED